MGHHVKPGPGVREEGAQPEGRHVDCQLRGKERCEDDLPRMKEGDYLFYDRRKMKYETHRKHLLNKSQ